MSHTVVNGEVRQFSASALELADTRTGGCLRKWWYRYVYGLREDEGDDMRRGTLMHGHLQIYLTTGVLPPSPAVFLEPVAKLACEMAHKVIAAGIVPAPGADLLVEAKIDDWGMTAGGVRLRGVIDLLHARGENAGVTDIEDARDPAGTIAVRDWKSKNSKATAEKTTKYLLTSADLPRSIQMSGYGLAALKRFPWAQRVRLEHGYAFTERPGPRVVTALCDGEQLTRTWEYVDALAHSIKDIAREPNVEKVDANRFACDRYGPKYLCMHAPSCTGYRNNSSLTTIFGETAAKDLKMSLMNTLVPGGVAVGANGTMVNLASEEAALRHQHELIAQGQTGVPVPQPAAPLAAPGTFVPQAIPVGFLDAWRAICAAGQGHPTMTAGAAQALAMACGQALAPGASYAGAGAMAQITLTDAMQVLQLAGDFGWRPAAVAPPMAPPAMPVTTTTPVYGPPITHVQHNTVAPMIGTPTSPTFTTNPVPSILAPEAPQSNPALASRPLVAETFTAQVVNSGGTVVASTPLAATVEAAPAKRRGRPPGGGRKATANTVVTPEATRLISMGAPVTDAAAAYPAGDAGGYELEIFVNCDADGDDVSSIEPYLERTLAALVAKFCPPPAIPDIRNAPNDGPLGFGKWPGALAATVREVPPAPGRYSLRVRAGDTIRTELANALRQVCEASGGLYVDGR